MAEELDKRRSRRALLAAAAGGAAALAANAALPLTAAAADPNDVVLGEDNPSTTTTSISNSTDGSTAFKASASGLGFGVDSFSDGSAGVYAVSIDGAEGAVSDDTIYTGVYGWAPAAPLEVGTFATGVWGDSGDVGVLGTGYWGIEGLGDQVGVAGYGRVGIRGETDLPGGFGVLAVAASTDRYALRVDGKIKTNRAGRKSVASGKSSVSVTLAGVSSASKVFAVLASSESGRWVRAVVPASGKFTVYFNTTLRSSASVSWFVID